MENFYLSPAGGVIEIELVSKKIKSEENHREVVGINDLPQIEVVWAIFCRRLIMLLDFIDLIYLIGAWKEPA